MVAQPFSSLVLFAPPRGTGDGDLLICPILIRLTCLCPHPLLTEPISISLCPLPIPELVFVLVPVLCFSYVSILSPFPCMSLTPVCLHPCLSLSVSSLSLSLPFSVFLPVSVCLPPSQSLCVSLALHGSPPHLCVSVPLS